MSLTNADPRLIAFRDRILRLEIERMERNEETREDIRDITEEMRTCEDVSKADIRGVKLNVRHQLADIREARTREKETADKRSERITAEQVAESLGDYADMPLGAAAVDRAARREHVQ